VDKRELQYAVSGALGIMALTCISYVIVWWFTPLDAVFPGLLYNSDDHGVYFAWMRQAESGRLLFRNLFTTEPQRGVYFHLYFLLLGWLARLPGIEIPIAYHLGRVLFGTVTLVLVYRLATLFTADIFTRRCMFWVTALSGGLGWTVWRDRASVTLPVDVWQPEALTFASLYTNGLFCVSLALMLGVVICLLVAETRGPRWAVAAGLCGLLLGNVHSYDVIHLTAAWTAYLLLRWIVGNRFPARELRLALLAALVASPSVAYMAWLYLAEPVFKARADTATWSPAPHLYLIGYGLLVPLAIQGGVLLWRDGPPGVKDPGGHPLRTLLPMGWAAAGILIAYAPFAFQRKMVMGEHLPLGLLAGIAVACLSRRAAGRLSRPRLAGAIAALITVLLSVSSILYVVRDVRVAFTDGVTSTGTHPVYWPKGTIAAFEWARRHTDPGSALLTWPMTGVLGPSYAGRAVYAGHWGETPRYSSRLPEAFAFYWGLWSSEERRQFLKDRGITHVLWSPLDRFYAQAWAAAQKQAVPPPRPLGTEPFLVPVFTGADAILYAVR
jgi:hypothetical protein